jgi:hypothetical protein
LGQTQLLACAGERLADRRRVMQKTTHWTTAGMRKGGERNYSSDAPGRREDRYCVGDIPKKVLNNRLKCAESL